MGKFFGDHILLVYSWIEALFILKIPATTTEAIQGKQGSGE